MSEDRNQRFPQDVAQGQSGSITVTAPRTTASMPETATLGNGRTRRRRTSLAARGEPMVWLTGGAVATCVLMIGALLAFVAWQGTVTFWPLPLMQLKLADGSALLGEPTREDTYVYTQDMSMADPIQDRPGMRHELVAEDPEAGTRTVRVHLDRTLYRVGNYDISGERFRWVNRPAIAEQARPEWGLVIERTAWGNAYGMLESLTLGDETITDPAEAWERFEAVHPQMRELAERRRDMEKHEGGEISAAQDEIRLRLNAAQREFGEDSEQYRSLLAEVRPEQEALMRRMEQLRRDVAVLDEQMATARLTVRATSGQIIPADRSRPDEPMLVAQVVRAYPPNQLSWTDKVGVYFSRWWEYLSDDPREANTEGGVFPAIVGTVLLTFVMIIFVVPIGVIAALYLREYARQGLVVSIVRISVNNLAGVPSIVYGVFGLGFFCYGVGAFVDGGSESPLPTKWWFAILTVNVLTAGLALALGFLTRYLFVRYPQMGRLPKTALWIMNGLLWSGTAGLLLYLVVGVPQSIFDGFFSDRLPDPTVGKSAMIWASLTLALLTLPVVIVATEEALAAVPRSMREGSYACGASKWQTIRRIVLPRAMPGIMTGMILAIARGAGEVAPLMLVGAVKLAPELPISADGPLFGLNRSFMHLGFHIYDLGFQSPDSEAARSMVYTTTLLLIAIVVVLNIAAILIRSRLRRAYAGGHF